MADDKELMRLLHEDYSNRAQIGVVNSMDADKDKAAESAAIERDTGQDAQVIYGNFDEYTQRRKSSLAQGLVERDNALLQYVNSHPMAANVSKDDWGVLSEISNLVKQHPYLGGGLGPLPATLIRAMPDILDNIKAGLGQMTTLPVLAETDPGIKEKLEELSKAAEPLAKGYPPEVQKQIEEYAAKHNILPQWTNLLMGALQVAGAPAIGMAQAFISKPIEEKFPDNFWTSREFTETAMLFGLSFFGMKAATPKAAVLDRVQDTVGKVDPYLRSGESPPVGADPGIDQIIGLDSKQKMAILDSIMDADKKSETKELNLDLFNNFTRIQNGNTSIYLRWNAAKAMYGDKVPTPDDGMLGWVPGIDKQFRDSHTTGADIEIPLADWRAKVDPEINKLLHDDLHFDDGMTINEQKKLPPPESTTISTIDEAAIPGLIQELDRPFKLSEAGEITDEGGNKVGKVKVAETDNGKTLVVHWEEGADNVAGLRSLLMQLKEQYPNAENITGPKTPGMQALEKALQGTKVRADIPFRIVEHPIDTARRAAGLDPLGLEKPLVQPLEAGGPTFEPGVLLPKRMYSKLMKAIDAVREKLADKMFDDAEREVKRRLTPEWKENFKKMREQVTGEIAGRPDFLVSAFFRNGRFPGGESHWMPKLNPKFLTPEQKRGIPKAWLSENGLDPDVIAGEFGYSTGADMVNKMVEFEAAKGKLQPREFFNKMVDEETARRMEQQYGKLKENIAKEAREHIVNKEQYDVLHEEYLRLGQLAGQELPMSKEDIRANAATSFNEKIASKVALIKVTRELGRSGRATHDAYLKKDYIGAFKARQEQLHLMIEADLAKKLEKTVERLETNLRQNRGATREGTPNEYLEWIHDVMFRIGRDPLRSERNLWENIAKRDEKSLEEFAKAKNNIGMPEGAWEYDVDHIPTLIVADFLQRPEWRKNIDALTVGEYKAVADTIQSLSKIGRDEGRSLLKGEVEATAKVKARLIKILEQQGVKKPLPPGKEPWFWQTTNAYLVQMEAFFNKLGHGEEAGEFLRRFSFEFARAEGEYTVDTAAASRKMIEIGKKYGVKRSYLRQKVRNDVFYEPNALTKDENGKPVIPEGGKEWVPMTRANLRAVLLNMGNSSNLQRIAEGYHTTVEKIRKWADDNATKEDWLWAQDVGREIFSDIIQEGADRMTMAMNDTLVELLPLGKVPTKAAGELDGWYYPIVYDRSRQGGPKATAERTWPQAVRTAQGWERPRTGSAGPVSLSIQPLANQIVRRLRDNHFRQVVHEARKILLDKEFLGAVTRFQGKQYADLFEPYLRDVAGVNGYTSAAEAAMERTFEGIRAKTIGVLIGYKIGTILKHGLTALAQSWREGGITDPEFYRSARSLYGTNSITSESNRKFMMEGGKVGELDWKGSTELQRRMRHFDTRIGVAADVQLGKMTIGERMLHWGAKPVALADMMSSQMVWHAKYQKVFKEQIQKGLEIEKAHTEAVDLADFAVRRTHGSTAITARPAIMRHPNTLVRSVASLYGFFNHVYNRFYEMAWRSKDVRAKWLRGEPIAKDVSRITGDAMFYVIVPALIEKAVSDLWLQSEKEDEDMTPWKFLAGGVVHTVAGAVPVLRDPIHAVLTGHDPGIGVIGVPFKAFTDLVRDINKEDYDDIKVGNIIHHAINAMGITTGFGTDQVGRWAKLVYNIMAGEDNPETLEEWYRGIRTGTSERRRH